MTLEDVLMKRIEYLTLIDVCYGILAKIHGNMCRQYPRGNNDDLTEDVTDIIMKILLLKEKVKKAGLDDGE